MIASFIEGEFMSNYKSDELEYALQKLMKLKKHYPILKPNTNKLMRAVTYSTARKKDHAYILKQITHWDERRQVFRTDGTGVYKPRGSVQSWTPDVKKFQESSPTGNQFIVKATVPESQLLFDMNFLNKVDIDVGIDSPEFEIMRVSKKPVKAEIYIETLKTGSGRSLREKNKYILQDLYDIQPDSVKESWPKWDRILHAIR